MTAEIFEPFPDLTTLRMSENQLERLEDDTFEPVKNLQELCMEFCG